NKLIPLQQSGVQNQCRSIEQKACSQSKIPVYKGQVIHDPQDKKSSKRTARHENELWKGIDQSLFLGPSGSVVWANVLVGRLSTASCKMIKF
ncbi:hypothetical protein DOY81_012944, partial [Sarcophaga bullata]